MEKIYNLLKTWKDEIFNGYNRRKFDGEIVLQNHKYYYLYEEFTYHLLENGSYVSTVDGTNKQRLRLSNRLLKLSLKVRDYISKNGFDKDKVALAKACIEINKKLNKSPQAKVGKSAAEILNKFLEAEECFKKGLYESGILSLLEGKEKADEYYKALANVVKTIKGGKSHNAKKLTDESIKKIQTFLLEQLKSDKPYKAAVAEAVEKWGTDISESSIRHCKELQEQYLKKLL